MNKIIVSQYYYNSISMIKQHNWGFCSVIRFIRCQNHIHLCFSSTAHTHTPSPRSPGEGGSGLRPVRAALLKLHANDGSFSVNSDGCFCFLQVRVAPPPPKQQAQGQVQKREEVEITLVWVTLWDTFYKLTLPCLDALREFGPMQGGCSETSWR